MAGETLQKFKSSINRGVTAISLKTSSSLEKAKIRTHIDSLQSEIDRLTTAAGEAAYAIWEAGESDISHLHDQFVLMQQKKAEIVQLEAEYASIDVRDNQILGASAASETAAPAAEAAPACSCPSCGATYAAPVNFCRKCGHKLRE